MGFRPTAVEMQYCRADVFEKAGLKPAETWEDVIENAKELSRDGVKVTGTTMRRGFWAGAAFITLLRCHGGDWFDKMEPRRLEGPARRRRPQGDGCADAPRPLHGADRAPCLSTTKPTRRCSTAPGPTRRSEWGGSTMNDPKYASSRTCGKLPVAKEAPTTRAARAAHMGGLGLIMPTYSHNKDAAWEWIKFCCSGDKRDPAIGKAWVDSGAACAHLASQGIYARAPYFSGMMGLPARWRCALHRIPESNALYEIVGTETAVVIGQTQPDQALKNMQKQRATRLMTKGGYYKS